MTFSYVILLTNHHISAQYEIVQILRLRKFILCGAYFYVTPPLYGEKDEVSMKSIMDLKKRAYGMVGTGKSLS